MSAKKNKPRIIVEYGNRRYEMLTSRDCTKHCSFLNTAKYGPCEKICNLPLWFRNLYRRTVMSGFAYLREIKEEVRNDMV